MLHSKFSFYRPKLSDAGWSQISEARGGGDGPRFHLPIEFFRLQFTHLDNIPTSNDAIVAEQHLNRKLQSSIIQRLSSLSLYRTV
jgi:hypothetical protein